MKKVPTDKIRTSTTTKVAGLSILAVLAVAFFAFPLGAFAAASAPKATTTVKLYAAYKIQTDSTSGDTGKFWPNAETSSQNLSPIGVTITTNATASEIPVGAIVQIKPSTPLKQTDGDGDILMPYVNALCIGPKLVTFFNGKQVFANLS
ncbi:MAG TPA: hypothetical protein VN207_08965 [Ktedonobacteraceae bacterium]|nr:hypothetical protein [Ktedonobacteraceae bacterium]